VSDDSPNPPSQPRQMRRRRHATQFVAFACLAGAVFIAASIGLFYYHSSTTGHRLIATEKQRISGHNRAGARHPVTPVVCAAPSDLNTTTPQGLILAKSIDLQAPVLGGDGDTQLNVAVGHVPGSTWPGGAAGTALFAAHDVTYFSHISNLLVGQTIQFATPCATYNYRVTGHQVVRSGSPIYTSPLQTLLVLETCYPLDALYITPKRYLVTAELTSVTHSGIRAVLPSFATPTIPAPSALAGQGLTLATNKLYLGTLDLQGSPSTQWTQSPAPINTEASVIGDYFAAIRSAEQNQNDWWDNLASPTAPFSSATPLRDASITGYSGQVSPILTVVGDTLITATLNATTTIAGGSAPGRYAIHVVMIVRHNTLTITQWNMSTA